MPPRKRYDNGNSKPQYNRSDEPNHSQRQEANNEGREIQGRGLQTELHSALKSSNLNLIRRNYQTGDNPYLSEPRQFRFIKET